MFFPTECMYMYIHTLFLSAISGTYDGGYTFRSHLVISKVSFSSAMFQSLVDDELAKGISVAV